MNKKICDLLLERGLCVTRCVMKIIDVFIGADSRRDEPCNIQRLSPTIASTLKLTKAQKL